MSQDVAPDVDTWIIQAKQLQVDIERSKATAREIVQEAETGKRLRDAAADCANKAGLLEKEVAFNTSLVETLGQIRAINVALNDCQDALLRNDLLSSLDLVKRTDADISNLAVVQNTRAYHILKTRLQDLRDGLAQRTTEEARKLVDVHVSEHRIIIAGKQSGMKFNMFWSTRIPTDEIRRTFGPRDRNGRPLLSRCASCLPQALVS